MKPLVSVSMNLHNSMRYIDETIQSLLAQTWKDFEAILVDDGSTDGTSDHIAKCYPDPRLKLIRQANKGMGKARAESVRHATGEYIAFLDHDDVWLPHKIERQLTMAAQHPDASLSFSDSLLINSEGEPLGSTSERYEYNKIDLRAGFAHDELLIRGCFITMSTAMVKLNTLLLFGGPNTKLGYGDDYDMWLHLSRNHPILYIDEKLAKWRIHESSMTERHPEISLNGHTQIWGPIVQNHTYPITIRKTVADHLFGQQRCAIRYLIKQRRIALTLQIALQIIKNPDPLVRFIKHQISQTRSGKFVIKIFAIVWKIVFGLKDYGSNLFLRIKNFVRSIPKRIQRESWNSSGNAEASTNVWIDGTSVNSFKTGYFNFVCEMIRSFALHKKAFKVHVIVPPEGKAILCKRLGSDASNLQFHFVEEKLSGRHQEKDPHWFAAIIQSLSKMLPQRLPEETKVEIVNWRGSFRFSNSLKIGVIHDITPRLFPDLHTSENVNEFDEYTRYLQRHADLIATVSEHSRRDIIEHIDVRPNSVRVVLSRIDPIYVKPTFNKQLLANHSLTMPYLFCVSTIEPRKNLRRLVGAFAMLKRAGAVKNHVLAIAGAQGWDDEFDEFLNTYESDIRLLGYVPLEDMPSLYRFASAFIYPSIYEGFGLPVLEAMCSSAKVITSNVSSLEEIAGDVVKTFNPHDEMFIAKTILTVLMMPKETSVAYRKQCRVRGKQLLRESVERPSIVKLVSNQSAEKTCELPSYFRL